MRISKVMCQKNMQLFIKSLGSIPKKQIKPRVADLDPSKIQFDDKFTISGSKEEREDLFMCWKEALKSITTIFDMALTHDIFHDISDDNSDLSHLENESNDENLNSKDLKILLIQKLSTSHECAKRILLEGFFKLFTISQINAPDFIW